MKRWTCRCGKFSLFVCVWIGSLFLVYLSHRSKTFNLGPKQDLELVNKTINSPKTANNFSPLKNLPIPHKPTQNNKTNSISLNVTYIKRGAQPQIAREITSENEDKLSFYQILHSDYHFRQESSDVIVFLHIQKTGGSYFSESLALFLNVTRPCDCVEDVSANCDCPRPGTERLQWLFSWHSVNWACGLHPALTWLTRCLPGKLDNIEGVVNAKRRYLYITMLRDPVKRYLSEYIHKRDRGGWGVSNWCEGRAALATEVEPCPIYQYHSVNMTLTQFMDCRSNLANNRQTMMLADLHLINCYNRTGMAPAQRDRILLESAKSNLEAMAFFAVSELQIMSQLVFEKTFRLTFTDRFCQYNHTRANLAMKQLTADQLERIIQLNSLDLQLYKFARTLLAQRARLLGVAVEEDGEDLSNQ